MSRRRGYSLIECLATIAMIGTVMTTVAVSMSGMQRASQRIREEVAIEADLQRLAAQLRADGHNALSAKMAGGKTEDAAAGSILLTLSDKESVRYSVKADHLQREHLQGEKLLHRESYRLPEDCTARWELEENDSVPLVSLTVEPTPGDAKDRWNNWNTEIIAAVGLLKPTPAKSEP
ncbi:MAG: type II secretion system protein [Planctomycetaceae bacterium]|jgi:prepilin-type N-terminal cleavage/methylation domain-containing protein|nr:type II secretion system protein [Planctomycetaceae bacterium]